MARIMRGHLTAWSQPGSKGKPETNPSVPQQEVHLGFSPKAAKLLIRKQGLDSPERLRVPIKKNVNDIYNVVRKPGGKNTNGTPDRRQQVSVKA